MCYVYNCQKPAKWKETVIRKSGEVVVFYPCDEHLIPKSMYHTVKEVIVEPLNI